jgi:hypothetical protein
MSGKQIGVIELLVNPIQPFAAMASVAKDRYLCTNKKIILSNLIYDILVIVRVLD